jgi:hypothetical protein
VRFCDLDSILNSSTRKRSSTLRKAAVPNDPEGTIEVGEDSWLTTKSEDDHAGYADELDIEADIQLEDRALLHLLADDVPLDEPMSVDASESVSGPPTAEDTAAVDLACDWGL